MAKTRRKSPKSKSRSQVSSLVPTAVAGSGLIPIGIVATGHVVPEVELSLGLEKLATSGFRPEVHPHVFQRDGFFAGTDEARAAGFWAMACRNDLPILWGARGGYGSIRILPYLERWTQRAKQKPPRKVLVGDSDLFVLHEFVRRHWRWKTVHAPMPSVRTFTLMNDAEWSATLQTVKASAGFESAPTASPWGDLKLTCVHPARRKRTTPIRGELNGGNITVWASSLGTRFAPRWKPAVLFLEDITEPYYRLDRVVQQILLAGGFENVQAIVLGNFLDCRDTNGQALASRPADQVLETVLRRPSPDLLRPLRPLMEEVEALTRIFAPVAVRYGIPIWSGLPAGHGPDRHPLWLGAEYRLTADGELSCLGRTK